MSHTDITAAWQNREALEDSQERFLALSQEIAHVGSWELDVDSRKLTWSDETFRIFGPEPQEIIAPTVCRHFWSSSIRTTVRSVDDAYTTVAPGWTGTATTSSTVDASTKDRGRSALRSGEVPCSHRDATGTVVRSTGMIEDITERVQAGESLEHADGALRASEALFRNVFEHHTAVKLLLDPATGKHP